MPVQIRPSSAGKWVNCPGSAKMEEGLPDGDTSCADEGTVAHWIAEKILKGETLPEIGTQWEVENKEVVPVLVDSGLPTVTFTQEMLDYVRKYTDAVRTSNSVERGILHVEEHVKIFDNLEGTPDLFLRNIEYDLLFVHDLKYGFQQIDARDNYQLLLYAHGILQTYPDWYAEEITLTIHQPRLDRIDSHTYTREEFDVKITELQWAASATQAVNALELLNPGDHCAKYYCKARATCPALNKFVLADLPDMEDVEDDIGSKLSKVSIIRSWCDAIEQEAYRLAVREGKPVSGYKVVQSRSGDRKWRSDQEAEQIMRSMRLRSEQMYNYKIISPTEAEKMFKRGTLGERRWNRLREVITRSDSKLLLVPNSDKRDAVDVITDLDLLDDLIGE